MLKKNSNGKYKLPAESDSQGVMWFDISLQQQSKFNVGKPLVGFNARLQKYEITFTLHDTNMMI